MEAFWNVAGAIFAAVAPIVGIVAGAYQRALDEAGPIDRQAAGEASQSKGGMPEAAERGRQPLLPAAPDGCAGGETESVDMERTPLDRKEIETRCYWDSRSF